MIFKNLFLCEIVYFFFFLRNLIDLVIFLYLGEKFYFDLKGEFCYKVDSGFNEVY